MNYFPDADNATGTITFPLNTYGAVNPQFAKTLAQANNPMFLSYKVVNNGVQPTGISVDPGSLQPLASRFQVQVNAKDLTHLFAQLYQLIEGAQALALPLMNVVFDFNYVYTVDESLSKLAFIYLPVAGGAKNINAAKEFFLDLPANIKPAGKEAQEMLTAFSGFMRMQEHLNVGALTNFLKNISMAKVEEEQYSQAPKHMKVELQAEEPLQQEVREAPGTMVLNAVEFSSTSSEAEQTSSEKAEIASQEPATSAVEKNPTPPPSLSRKKHFGLFLNLVATSIR